MARSARVGHDPQAPDAPVAAHTLLEDLVGFLTGTFVVSLGLFLLSTGQTVTGGTAGLSLLIGYHQTVLPFGAVFALVNAPFFLLAIARKGWGFALRSGIAIAMVSGWTALHPLALRVDSLDPFYAALGGSTLAGIGVLILFRHGSSLGGFNIIALILQERLGWRAGWVLMALDAAVVLLSLTAVDPFRVLVSAAGVVVLNLILALNHRPGRYTGSSGRR